MIVNGDARVVLERVPSDTFHMAVTSPPYYSPVQGLREYEITELLWPDGWKGNLGEEPTPQMYVSHISLIAEQVHRTLRPEGTWWLNIGDSRAGSGRGPSGKNAAVKGQEERQGFVGKHQQIPSGFKRKDMFGIPFRVGMALQEAGWYWRDCIPWIKRNGMIASYNDRPVSNIEWILILTKSSKNYYDHVAMMQTASESYLKDKRPKGVLRQRVNEHTKYDRSQNQFRKQDSTGNKTYTGLNKRYAETGSCDKRFFRSSDFFFKSFQGLLLDEEDQPLAMIINPTSHRWKHTAGFPVLLPQTCIRASTSERGVCADCGAPLKRISEKHYLSEKDYEIATLAWEPTCNCGCETPVPATVLDPFNGTGATGVACKNTGRKYVGIELSASYCGMSEQRIAEGR